MLERICFLCLSEPEQENKMPKRDKQLKKKFRTPQARSGHLGGLKGGPARASKLGKRKRSKIAAMGAAQRWGGRR